MKKMLTLIILGIVLLTFSLFLGIVHVTMLAAVIGKDPIQIAELSEQPGLIGYISSHITLYGLLLVLPLPFLLAAGLFCVIFGSIKGKKLNRQ